MSKMIRATDESGISGTVVLRGERGGLVRRTLRSFDDDEFGSVSNGRGVVGVGLVTGYVKVNIRSESVTLSTLHVYVLLETYRYRSQERPKPVWRWGWPGRRKRGWQGSQAARW